MPTFFPAEAEIAVNLPVLAFSVLISMLTGVVCGLWPALRVSRTDLRDAMNSSAHKLAGRRGARATHVVLLTAQVAMTMLLLACAGATVRKLVAMAHADVGYDPRSLASVNLVMREGAHDEWADRVHYYEQIRGAIAADPNVVSAAIGALPFRNLQSTPVDVPGRKASGVAVEQHVSREYFSTAGIPLRMGREWTRDETTHGARLALINETMRRQYWPNANPIGETIVLNHGVVNGDVWKLVAPGDDQHFQIIGVVGDVPNRGLDEAVYPGFYIPYSMTPYDGFNVAFRARGDPAGLLHAIKEHVRGVDANQAVGELISARDELEGDSLPRERFAAGLFGAFAFLALAFAVSGLYSVQAFLVAQRTREFGVRIAMGAKRAHIVYLVTRECVAAVLGGAVAGVVLVVALNQEFLQWTSSDARDPWMVAGIVLVLLAAASAASVVPARMAASIEPVEALRME
jgi:predicted permease